MQLPTAPHEYAVVDSMQEVGRFHFVCNPDTLGACCTCEWACRGNLCKHIVKVYYLIHNVQHYDEKMGDQDCDGSQDILDMSIYRLQDDLVEELENTEYMSSESHDQLRRDIGLLQYKIDKVVGTNIVLAQQYRTKMIKALSLLQGLFTSTSTEIGNVLPIPYVNDDYENSLVRKSSFISPHDKDRALRKK